MQYKFQIYFIKYSFKKNNSNKDKNEVVYINNNNENVIKNSKRIRKNKISIKICDDGSL